MSSAPRVSVARKWLDLTQVEFASIAGVTRSTVARWEGDALVPSWLGGAIETGSWRSASAAAGHEAGEALREALYEAQRRHRSKGAVPAATLYPLLRALLEGRLGRASVAPKRAR